ncbi:hypothetical protein [Micropruina glycogenica]|uniref:hypothetical protein n=1 Tax=Micropruina glycogenica TaxID=75385 RepID=UPI001E45ACEE|nr:hypothetical protein [Micropruina glycogenica]
MSTAAPAKTPTKDSGPRIPGFAQLQRLGKSLMLPIALLPAAGILLRLGQPDLLGQIKIPVIGPFFEAMSAAATPSSATSPYCSPWAWPSASPRRRTARPPCLRWPATWS